MCARACESLIIVRVMSCYTICYLVFWPDSDSFSNAEDQDSHTISLSQLEVILIKMRFMEEDAVYQAKRVLVLIYFIEHLFVLGEVGPCPCHAMQVIVPIKPPRSSWKCMYNNNKKNMKL